MQFSNQIGERFENVPQRLLCNCMPLFDSLQLEVDAVRSMIGTGCVRSSIRFSSSCYPKA
jgi:hypothetical protein